MKLPGTWLVVCLSLTTAVQNVEAGNGGWSTVSFEQAQRLAADRGVTLLVHFYADWCGPCQRMERDVFSRQDVSAALGAGIVSVKVNSDRRKDLTGRYGVRSLPSDVSGFHVLHCCCQ